MLRNFCSFLCVVAILAAPRSAVCADITFPTDVLSIATSGGNVPFTVEVATTDAQHARGLMYRTQMVKDHGMIFDLAVPQHVNMWMKSTLIPLDMLFIDHHGIITQIVKSAAPQSTSIISSTSDAVVAVLEINGGAADYYHIAKGDRVIYPLFK